MKPLYDSPEAHGCEVLDELHDSLSGWDYDLVVLYRHKESKKLYFASDSGCSCPSPGDSIVSLSDCTELTDQTWQDFEATVDGHCGDAASKTEFKANASKELSLLKEALKE